MNGLITFTPAQKEDDRWLGSGIHKNLPERRDVLSGEEAKRFYQSLIDEGESEGAAICRRRQQRDISGRKVRKRELSRDAVAPERVGHQLLRCAQDGDLAGLKELLKKKGCDINFRDDYYWTAIMCASYAGQRAAVQFLLQKGAAWVGVVDTQGRDARDLAEQAGHEEVVRELERFGGQQETPKNVTSIPLEEPRWCSTCGTQYSDKNHSSSTAHQLSLHRPKPVPHYCLPPSNAGFRMMLREGWEPGAGLGPRGGGCMQPIRTVLKRDQTGLGYGPTPRARVTHFVARDTRAVKAVAPAGFRTGRGARLSRQAQRRKEEKDRNWERNFRTYFNL